MVSTKNLFFVQFCGLKVRALNLIRQPLWAKHLDERTSGEERSVEVRGGPQGELKVGVVVFGGHFLLAVVQRKVAQVVHMLAKGPDGHLFYRGVLHRLPLLQLPLIRPPTAN